MRRKFEFTAVNVDHSAIHYTTSVKGTFTKSFKTAVDRFRRHFPGAVITDTRWKDTE